MSMMKIIPADSYDFEESPTKIIKISSRGLIGNDLTEFVKRAGHQLASQIKNLNLEKDEVPIHLIALGATEAVGPNRNGDGFKIATCKKYHPTFVKLAKFYRNHKNKDPNESYGIVKLSYFNDIMKRVELVVALNSNKEAADRNKGLIADKELNKLEKNSDIAVSMACIVNPESLIFTHHGYKPIKDVRTKDLVLTHKNNWKQVVELTNRKYTGKIIRIYFNEMNVPLELTEDHLLYAKTKFSDTGKIDFSWLHCSHLKKGDIVAQKIVKNTPYKGMRDNSSFPGMLNTDTEIKKDYLGSWLDVSGYCNDLGMFWIDDRLRIILYGRDILSSLGIKSKIIKFNNKYKLFVNRFYSSELKNYSKKIISNKYLKKYFDDQIKNISNNKQLSYYSISNIETEEVENILVWNLEVEEDQSYTIYGMVSHNCKVSHDICSGCGNKAKNRDEYCTESMCKYGGLKNNIAKVFEDGHILHADNPDPMFMDISHVFRPADRTAWVLGKI